MAYGNANFHKTKHAPQSPKGLHLSKMFVLKWRLGLRIVKWMFPAKIRPILTYGSLAWWTATKMKGAVNNYIRSKGPYVSEFQVL